MVNITMLNSMASQDFRTALDRHVAWGIAEVDLKDAIFGKSIVDLSDAEASKAAELIRERQLSTYALSTSLFADDIEIGPEAFRKRHLHRLPRVLEIARILKPKMIRLIAAWTAKRGELSDSIAYVRERHPWVIDFYGEAIAEIGSAGFTTAIENETARCLLSIPREVLEFFDELPKGGKAVFTWDVVNLWQAGCFPSPRVYDQLSPVIGYIHYKGGQSDHEGRSLRWKSTLDEASWPVEAITSRVIADGRCECICLNPPHGSDRPGTSYDDLVERDLSYLKNLIEKGAAL